MERWALLDTLRWGGSENSLFGIGGDIVAGVGGIIFGGVGGTVVDGMVAFVVIVVVAFAVAGGFELEEAGIARPRASSACLILRRLLLHCCGVLPGICVAIYSQSQPLEVSCLKRAASSEVQAAFDTRRGGIGPVA